MQKFGVRSGESGKFWYFFCTKLESDLPLTVISYKTQKAPALAFCLKRARCVQLFRLSLSLHNQPYRHRRSFHSTLSSVHKMADAPETDGAAQEQTAQMEANGLPAAGGKVKTQKERTQFSLLSD